MNSCYCDYEPPAQYRAIRPIARVTHRCDECGRIIRPGERYENVCARWERGDPWETVSTCCYCLALRDLVERHAKCFCWTHFNLREDIHSWIGEDFRNPPGLAFALGRIEIERRHDL